MPITFYFLGIGKNTYFKETKSSFLKKSLF